MIRLRPIFFHQALQECGVHVTVAECGAAYYYFFSSPAGYFRCLRHGADSSANADAHFEFGCGGAELADQLRVASLSHCGVEIDYVDQRVGAKPVEQAEDIVDG